MERLINISMIGIVCVYIVTLNKKRKGRRIIHEMYPGSPNPTISSLHTSCEIIQYCIVLTKTYD